MADHARTTRWVDRTLSTLAPLPLPLLHALGATLGTLLAYLPNEAQRVARLNLALCFPHLRRRERRRLLRHSLAETGKAALELAPVLKRSPKRLERWIRGVHGASHVQEAIARRQGVVLLAPHLGCWELLNLWLAARYPLTALYRPPRQAALEPILIAARTRNGGRLAPADRRGVRSVLHALARREMAGILPDQEPEGPAPFAPFFGFPAKTMTLAGRVAERSGATPVLAFAERLPRGRGFVLHFLPADPELAATDPQTATAALNRSIEACVQRAPPQYQWTYKRFSTRPDGARLYPRRRRRHRNLQ
ncbi:MAG: lipid A biosynthesis acyltransferase [Halorhodospira sp.]